MCIHCLLWIGVRPKQSREVMIARRELDNALRLLTQAGEKLVLAAELLDKTGKEGSQSD